MASVKLGTVLLGRLWKPDGTYIATKFFYVWLVPLFPLGTYQVFSEHGDGFQGQRIPLSLKSVASGYFKLWGLWAAIGGSVAWVLLAAFRYSDVSWWLVYALPVACIVVMAATISSWIWVGRPPGHKKKPVARALGLGLPILAMMGAVGYEWMDRWEREASIAANRQAEIDEETARKAEAEKENERLTRYYEVLQPYRQPLYEVHTAVAAKKDWPNKKCDAAKIKELAGGDRGLQLLAVDISYLPRVYGGTAKSDDPRAWSASPVLTRFNPDVDPEGKLVEELAARPLMAVFRLHEQNGKINAWTTIIDRETATAHCDMFVSVDSGGANGGVPTPEVQAAFRAEAQKQLAKISKELSIYSEP